MSRKRKSARPAKWETVKTDFEGETYTGRFEVSEGMITVSWNGWEEKTQESATHNNEALARLVLQGLVKKHRMK